MINLFAQSIGKLNEIIEAAASFDLGDNADAHGGSTKKVGAATGAALSLGSTPSDFVRSGHHVGSKEEPEIPTLTHEIADAPPSIFRQRSAPAVSVTTKVAKAATGKKIVSSEESDILSPTHDLLDGPPDMSRQQSAPVTFTPATSLSPGSTPASLDSDNGEAAAEKDDLRYKDLEFQTRQLLVVLDMDHTLVGDLESLSDRDNVETNVPWEYWKEGVQRGLKPSEIVPFLERGVVFMLFFTRLMISTQGC